MSMGLHIFNLSSIYLYEGSWKRSRLVSSILQSFIPSFIYLFDTSSIYSFFHSFRISFIHSSISLQTEFHFLIFIVWLSRDRFRTVVNVLGDAIGAGIVGHLSRDELKNADQADMEEGGQGDEKHELLVPSEGRYVKKDPDQNYSPRMTSFKRSSEE